MDLMKSMPIIGFAIGSLTLLIVFKPMLGAFTTMFGALFALGALSFLGWFFIEHTH